MSWVEVEHARRAMTRCMNEHGLDRRRAMSTGPSGLRSTDLTRIRRGQRQRTRRGSPSSVSWCSVCAPRRVSLRPNSRGGWVPPSRRSPGSRGAVPGRRWTPLSASLPPWARTRRRCWRQPEREPLDRETCPRWSRRSANSRLTMWGTSVAADERCETLDMIFGDDLDRASDGRLSPMDRERLPGGLGDSGRARPEPLPNGPACPCSRFDTR